MGVELGSLVCRHSMLSTSLPLLLSSELRIITDSREFLELSVKIDGNKQEQLKVYVVLKRFMKN